MFQKTSPEYYAEDGTMFNNSIMCSLYERDILKNSTIECWRFNGERVYDLEKEKPNNIGIVRLNDEKDKVAFNILFCDYKLRTPDKLSVVYIRKEDDRSFCTIPIYERCFLNTYLTAKQIEEDANRVS